MLGLQVFLACLLGACCYALWRGGAPERIVAGLFLTAWVASIVGDFPFAARFFTVAPAVLVIDGLLFAALLAVALRADRYWPMAVVSLQVIILLAHLMRVLDPELIRRVYSILINLPVYPQLLLLAAGAARHRQRLKRHGSDPSWSNFSGPARRQMRSQWQIG
jgi:hypothetical protein